MLAPSHLVFGQFAFLGAALITGHLPTATEAVLAAVSALLPDLDKRDGVVGRWFPWISGPVEYWVGHRTATHSILAAVVVWLLSWPLPDGYRLALVAGFASHPVADMMTPAGVAWFWPSRVRCVLPGNVKYRMPPMSLGELWFVIVIAVLSIPLASLARYGSGPLGTVRDMLGWFQDARSHYDAHKSEADWWLEITGQDNRTFESVSGLYRVIGPWQGSGMILETPGGPVTACHEGDCDWYVERSILRRGQEERVTSQSIRVRATSVAALRQALEPLEATGRVYLSGSVRGRVPSSPPTVMAGGGDMVKLTFASLSILRGWPDVGLYDVDLIVQLRHAPGSIVPSVSLDALDAGAPDLSPFLARHMPDSVKSIRNHE